MRFRLIGTVIAMLAFSAPFFAQQIRGDYVETRSADVYTGQCFANGEVNLVGNEAILAWRVQDGSWTGATISGFTVAAAVHAKATLGDPYADPYPAQAVLLVDDQASPEQQVAFASFARHMGGKLLANADNVLPVQMELVVSYERHGVAMLRAGRFATVETRSLNGQRSPLRQRRDFLSSADAISAFNAGGCPDRHIPRPRPWG